MKKQLFTALLIGILSINSIAQTKEDIQKINNKIEVISKDNKEFKKETKQVLDSIKRTNYYTKENIKISKQYFENASGLENKTFNYIGILAFFILSILIGLIAYSFKLAEKRYQNKLDEKLKLLEKENTTTLDRLVKDKFWEYDLMQKSNLIVVNPNKEKENKGLNPVLEYFTSVDVGVNSFNDKDLINKIKDNIVPDKLNIILIENTSFSEDEEWNPINTDQAKKIVKSLNKLSNDLYILYFGPKSKGFFPSEENDYPDNIEISNKISFVNAPSKLYSAIIDTLKYMDIMAK